MFCIVSTAVCLLIALIKIIINSVHRPRVQLNRTSYLKQFTNYYSNNIHYQHFSTTPQDSSFLRQHRHRLTVTIRAYDSNFCFDIWRVTNADYLLTYLNKKISP